MIINSVYGYYVVEPSEPSSATCLLQLCQILLDAAINTNDNNDKIQTNSTRCFD